MQPTNPSKSKSLLHTQQSSQEAFIFVFKKQKSYITSNLLMCTIQWILIIFTMPHSLPLSKSNISLGKKIKLSYAFKVLGSPQWGPPGGVCLAAWAQPKPERLFFSGPARSSWGVLFFTFLYLSHFLVPVLLFNNKTVSKCYVRNKN